MCGIAAIFSRQAPVAPATIERATRSLYHRGPDGQRHWISADGRVALGHARLSIIDLATGDQPIASEDERTRIIVNGEFYDFEAIQHELERGGHRLRTRSDSEIALHLYEDVGLQCVHRLRGEFAIVLWDERNRTLVAVRDRFGIKPLFYAWHDGALYLASEVKALFAAGVPARWDTDAVSHSVELRRAADEHALRRRASGAARALPDRHRSGLPAASVLGLRLSRRQRMSVSALRSEYVEEFRGALDEAVRLRLRADVPVGCYLSGGLDSCAVIGLAARHHPDPIRAFTLTFDRPDYDEEREAREMATRVGAEFHPIPIGQDDLADHLADAVHQAESFCLNAHGVAKYLLSRAVRDAGYKVVITGEGSDEILGGYAHFRRDMLMYNREGQDPTALAAMLQQLEALNPVSRGLLLPDGASKPLDHVKRRLGFVPSWMETFSARAAKLDDPVLAGLCAALWIARELQRAAERARRAGAARAAGIRCTSRCTSGPRRAAELHPDHCSAIGWRWRTPSKGACHSSTITSSRCVRSQPVNQKINGMTEKYVLREAVRDVITDTVYRRQKHPFLSPPATLNPQGKLHALVQDTLRGTGTGVPALLRSEERGGPARSARHDGRGFARRKRCDPDDSRQRLHSAGALRSRRVIVRSSNRASGHGARDQVLER